MSKYNEGTPVIVFGMGNEKEYRGTIRGICEVQKDRIVYIVEMFDHIYDNYPYSNITVSDRLFYEHDWTNRV